MLLPWSFREWFSSRRRPIRNQRTPAKPSRKGPTLELLEDRLVPTGTWQTLNPSNPAAGPPGTQAVMLLSDGSVMVQGGVNAATRTWFRLTPDLTGSYVTGKWSSLASMNEGRLFFTTAMLQDGRVFAVGGEYSDVTSDSNTAEIYDPLANKWTSIPSPPTSDGAFGDDPIEVLPNGQVLAGHLSSPDTYRYDPTANSWTTTAGTKLRNDQSDEETWVKLPDNSILSYDVFSSDSTGVFHGQRYVPSSDSWVDASNVNPLNPPAILSGDPQGFELGPGFLENDLNHVIFFGANGNTAVYNISANQWSAGPKEPVINIGGVPTPLVATDDPGAMMPNGKILISLSPLGTNPGSGYTFPSPSYVYEFDPSNGSFTDITPPGLTNENAFELNMLVLPTGQVMLTNESGSVQIYTPDGTPPDFARPTITNIAPKGGGVYTLTGTQLNGISEGANYGDDNESATNYPIIQLIDKSGNVRYARTFNWSSTGVATGSAVETVDFTLPFGLNVNQIVSYTVIANGIPSEGLLAFDASFSTNEDTALNASVVGTGAPPLTYGVVTQPTNGTLTSFNVSTGAFTYVPDANYFGPDSFTFQVTNSNGFSNVATVSITVNPVADPPKVTPSSASTLEDTQTSQPFVITHNAVDGSEVTNFFITNVRNGQLFRADGVTPIAPNTYLSVGLASAGLKFTPDVDENDNNNTGGVGFGFDVVGSLNANPTGLGGSTTVNITVTPVNDQPTFNIAGDVTVDEDSGPFSQDLFATNVTRGPATALDEASQGLTFNLSTTNDSLFSVAPAINPTTGQLTFTPADFASGVVTVTVTLTDDGGTANNGVDSSTKTFVLTINPVLHPPSATDASTIEDVQTTDGLVITPNAHDTTSLLAFKIINVLNGNVYLNDGTTLVPNGGFVTTAQAAAGLKFTPAADQNDNSNVGGVGFGFDVQGSTTTDNSGVGGPTLTVVIPVAPVNDAPTFVLRSPSSVTVYEDSGAFTGLKYALSRQPGPATALDEVNQKLTYAITTDNDTLFSSLPFINAAGTLTFTPKANAFGVANVTIMLSDDGGTDNGGIDFTQQVFPLTILPVADVPVVPPTTTNEDTQSGAIVISPNPVDGNSVTYYKISNFKNGRVFFNDGVTPVSDGSLVTAAQAAAGLKFTPNANQNNNTVLGFSFDVQAATSNLPADLGGMTTATISVLPVNDAPSFSQSSTPIIVKENSNPFSQTGFASNLSPGPATATDEANQKFSFTLTTDNDSLFSFKPAIDPATGTLTFTLATDAFGVANVTVMLFDDGGTANNGVNFSQQKFVITVLPVPETPSVTPATTNEDTQTSSGLVISRNPVDGPEITSFKITNITNGTLYQNDGFTQIHNGDFLSFAQANAGLKFTPPKDQNDLTTLIFSFDVQASSTPDDSGLGGNVVTAVISVQPVNDAPGFSLSGNAVKVAEDSGDFSQSGFATNLTRGPVTATDEATQTLSFTLPSDNDALFSVKPHIDVATGTLAFTPAPDAFGVAHVTVTLMDDGGTAHNGVNSVTLPLTITITPVIDNPTVSPATTNEDTPTTSGLVVLPYSKDGPEVTNFYVSGLSIGSLTTSTGKAVANNTFITRAEGAAGLRYTPPANFNGTVTFTVQAAGGTTLSSLGASPVTATVTVLPVNDPPTANPDTFAVTGEATLNVMANDSDFPDTGETLSLVGVSQGSAGGTVQVVGNQVLYQPRRFFSGTETFSYTISDGALTASAMVTLNVTQAPPKPVDFIVEGTDAGTPGRVRVMNASGQVLRELAPFGDFAGGLNVATADVNGDGVSDIIVATASGAGHFMVFDGRTGAVIMSIMPFGAGFTGGLSVAAGDLDGDGDADVVVGVMNGPAHVVAYSGATGAQIRSFFAYDNYNGGVRVAVGDVDGDQKADIATVAGPGGNGHIRAFDGRTGAVIRSFLAYVDFAGEISIAVAFTAGGPAIVTTALAPGIGTHVKETTGVNNDVLASFYAPADFNTPPIVPGREDAGLAAPVFGRVAAGDVNGDGIDDLLLIHTKSQAPTELLILDGATMSVISLTFAFDSHYTTGASVAAG